MHVELFKAMKVANLSDEQATVVVAQMEDFIVRTVETANKGIEAKLDALDKRLTFVGTFVGVMIGLATLLIAGATLATRFIH